MKNFFIMIGASLLLAGCASAPGAFKHEDFHWESENLTISYQEAYKRLVDGGRSCIGPGYFRLNGYVFEQTKSGYFDVFLPEDPIFRIKSDYVAGKVEFFKNSEETTSISIGILHKYYNPKDPMGFKKQIKNYLDGSFTCDL